MLIGNLQTYTLHYGPLSPARLALQNPECKGVQVCASDAEAAAAMTIEDAELFCAHPHWEDRCDCGLLGSAAPGSLRRRACTATCHRRRRHQRCTVAAAVRMRSASAASAACGTCHCRVILRALRDGLVKQCSSVTVHRKS